MISISLALQFIEAAFQSKCVRGFTWCLGRLHCNWEKNRMAPYSPVFLSTGFIRKVYLITTLQLVGMAGLATILVRVDPVFQWLQHR